MPRPTHATIDRAALRHNFAVARRHAGQARIWSVIKADGYGHGLLRVADALADSSDGFALIELDSALALRAAGFRHPILMLEGFYSPEEIALFAEHRLVPVLHSPEQVAFFHDTPLPIRLPVVLKLETGMHRLGLDEEDFHSALAILGSLPTVSGITLMTHFADADSDRGVASQWQRLAEMTADLDYPLCAANSAALLRFPETRADWVRPGIMLYGSSPFPEQSADTLDLRPVMTLASEVIAVRDLKPGDRVGYGGLFVAETPMRLGVVACGYADGYPRHASTGTPVLVDGRRTRILGRVSMDKLCVDLTDLDEAGIGAPVVLWGEADGDRLDADEVAAAAGTVSYELFCALSQRVPVTELG